MCLYLVSAVFLIWSAYPLAGEPADTVDFSRLLVQPDTLRMKVSSIIRLGLDQLERDNDSRMARKTLESAIALNPDDPRIYIGIGRSFLERKARKLRILDIIERLFDKDYISKAIDNFNKAVELDEKNWEAHYWLATAYMRRFGDKDLDRALEHMTLAYQLGGRDRRNIRLKLAALHKALGDIDNAEQILAEIGGLEERKVDPLANLELAKIEICRGNYSQGLRYYWRGLEAISTGEELKAYYDDVAIIATVKEKQKFTALTPDSTLPFFRSFWLKRDHEMGLSPGMRLIQHYHRLNAADSLYRVPFAVRNPAISPAAPFYPEVATPYDDRGIIYIRHGSPDQTVSYLSDGMHPNETWIYHRAQHDFIVHFVALLGNSEYQLVSTLDAAVKNSRGLSNDPESLAYPSNSEEAVRLGWIKELYSSRFEVGNGIYARLYDHPEDPFLRMEEYDRNTMDILTALKTESSDNMYSQHLTSFYDMVEFRGNNQEKSILEFFAGVPGREISYDIEKEGYSYNISYQLAICSSDWKQVGQLNRTEHFQTRINPHDLMDKLVVSLGSMELAPGYYYYFVKIRNGEAISNFNGNLKVDSFAGDSLQISQIIAAQNIVTSAADSSKFKRYNLEVHPNPSRVYHPYEKMYAYQEIYNLKPDIEGNLKYRMTYTISSIKRVRNIFGLLFDSFKTIMGSGPVQERVVLAVDKKKVPAAEKMVNEDVAIDISDNPDGLYELSIKVEDLNDSGKVFQRNTRFIVRR